MSDKRTTESGIDIKPVYEAKDIADLQVAYRYLQTRNAEKPDLGIGEVLALIQPMLAKYKHLQTLK